MKKKKGGGPSWRKLCVIRTFLNHGQREERVSMPRGREPRRTKKEKAERKKFS